MLHQVESLTLMEYQAALAQTPLLRTGYTCHASVLGEEGIAAALSPTLLRNITNFSAQVHST